MAMITLRDFRKEIWLLVPALALVLPGAVGHGARLESVQDAEQRHSTPSTATFYRNALPILQERCQICHRAEGIAPARFETYEQTRLYAKAIKLATQNKSMPPWFADPHIGHFSNDPSLSAGQIAALAAWADSGAPSGDPNNPLAHVPWGETWSI